jgi:hypothetical protein
MTGGGAERPAIGIAAGNLGESDGTWVVERQHGGGWNEVERFGSEVLARQRLDELAADEGIPLEHLRVRELGD